MVGIGCGAYVVVRLAEVKTNSAQLELELGLSLAIIMHRAIPNR